MASDGRTMGIELAAGGGNAPNSLGAALYSLGASFVRYFRSGSKPYYLLIGLLLTTTVVTFTVLNKNPFATVDLPAVPRPKLFADLYGRPLYVFGDSTVDAGNYNITSYPYGLDLVDRSPARFTNGLTIADLLAKKLSTPTPRAYNYLGPVERRESNVNFATGGCGVLPRTHAPIACTPLKNQITELGDARPKDLGRAVFFLSAGANDYVFSFEKAEVRPSPDEFAKEVVGTLESYLQELYDKGARTFIINNIGPVGCVPDERHKFLAKNTSSTECDEGMNEAVRKYNTNLENALHKFAKSEGVSVILADSHKLFTEIMSDQSEYGFHNVVSPCCGKWRDDMGMYECKRGDAVCDRKAYLFFDGAHTTEEANKFFVEKCFSGLICRVIG